MKILLRILNYIGCITFYIICNMFLDWLLKQSDNSLYLELFLYFGMGILLYYPIHYILKHTENEK